MNRFDQKLKKIGRYPLAAKDITTLQVNIGYKCNLRCAHCHVEASPERNEMMSLSTMSRVLTILKENHEISTVDITGGSPELHPFFKFFLKSCVDMGKDMLVRTNLAVYAEPDMHEIPEFLAENKAIIIASLPCYTESGVDSQRGNGTYKKAVEALKKLNSLGYGRDDGALKIDIMFNPSNTDIAPDQSTLEKTFKEKLDAMHGITFNNLIAISNMPIGRFGKYLAKEDYLKYHGILKHNFNPETVSNVMCRNLISVSPDGKFYDCDFWQMLNLPVKSECSDVQHFDYYILKNREIVTNELCFMCTAGAGASCSGALT